MASLRETWRGMSFPQKSFLATAVMFLATAVMALLTFAIILFGTPFFH